jgi:hypothetical protein
VIRSRKNSSPPYPWNNFHDARKRASDSVAAISAEGINRVAKVLNPYIIHFERYKKEKLEKVKRV